MVSAPRSSVACFQTDVSNLSRIEPRLDAKEALVNWTTSEWLLQVLLSYLNGCAGGFHSIVWLSDDKLWRCARVRR